VTSIKESEVVRSIRSGKLRHHELESKLGFRVSDAAALRRKFLEEETKTKLEHVGRFSINLEPTLARNIESAIGCVQIPVGIAGPVKIHGKEVMKDERVYIPLCTLEGALVASVNRGCRAINESGGANARIVRNGMTRAPAFVARNLETAADFAEFVEKNFSDIKKIFEKDAEYLHLTGVRSWIVGRTVFVRFTADTADAMGMNMMTLATTRTCKWLEAKASGIKCSVVSGNLCVDKKPSAMNLIEGRGKTVIAEVRLSRKVISSVLKTTPESILDSYFRKVCLGSSLSVSLGLNSHSANVVAALFLATGQDAAQVVESSMAITTVEPDGDDVYFSVTLPSLEVGVVGGGTSLPTQKEMLGILKCVPDSSIKTKPGASAKRLAEIIATAVLAGEISLLASLSEGTLASSHEKLGRGEFKGKL